MLWLSFLVTLVTASDGEEREKWQFSESLRTETHRCTSLEFDFIGELRYIDYLTNGCLVDFQQSLLSNINATIPWTVHEHDIYHMMAHTGQPSTVKHWSRTSDEALRRRLSDEILRHVSPPLLWPTQNDYNGVITSRSCGKCF